MYLESVTDVVGYTDDGVRLNSDRTGWNLHEEATKIKASFGGREAEGV